MDQIWKKYRKWISLVIVAIGLVLGLLIWQFNDSKQKAAAEKVETYFSADKKTKKTASSEGTNKPSPPRQEIIVDMKGAVRKPGIYRMSSTDRVSDAINKAGGLADKADRDKVNLAQKVSDEMVVYVPEKGEDLPKIQAGGAAATSVGMQPGNGADQTQVNINTADEQELQNLPGIGPAKAKTIIQYREEHGLFKSVEDLTNVSGIGEKSLEKIKPQATIQ